MPLSSAAILDDQAEPVAIQPPSQLALESLAETMAALLDEACALLSVTDLRTALADLSLTSVPAFVWHTLPGPVISSKASGRTWKRLVIHGQARITAWCDHADGSCPDLPRDEQP